MKPEIQGTQGANLKQRKGILTPSYPYTVIQSVGDLIDTVECSTFNWVVNRTI
jgi:hypothetical protein